MRICFQYKFDNSWILRWLVGCFNFLFFFFKGNEGGKNIQSWKKEVFFPDNKESLSYASIKIFKQKRITFSKNKKFEILKKKNAAEMKGFYKIFFEPLLLNENPFRISMFVFYSSVWICVSKLLLQLNVMKTFIQLLMPSIKPHSIKTIS